MIHLIVRINIILVAVAIDSKLIFNWADFDFRHRLRDF